MSKAIPVGQACTEMKVMCADGQSVGKLMLRRIKRSEQIKIMEAVGYTDGGGTVNEMKLAQMVVRVAVVGSENLCDEDANSINYSSCKHPALGEIAEIEVVDAIGNGSIKDVFKFAMNGLKLGEESEKN